MRIREWWSGVAVAALAVGSLALAAAPDALAVPTAITSRVTSPASDAASASKEAVRLRADVSAMLKKYTDQYDDRFTASELATLDALRVEADRKLIAVVNTSGALKNLTAHRGSTAQVRSAADRAIGAWTRGKAAAETSWSKASAIMEPKLGLFEKLGALNDYNAMMDRFDALGDHLKALQPSGS
jgi:hypothetical protein